MIKSDERGVLENAFYKARTSIQDQFKFMDGFMSRSKQIAETAKAHTMTTIDYISDEGNTIPKAIAITGGGLFGLLLSARRGFLRKLIYTSAGVATMTGVCYPKQSKETLEVAGYIFRNKAVPVLEYYTGLDIKKYVLVGSDSEEKSEDNGAINKMGEQVSDVNQLGFRLK